jgi:hypothetical protein
LQKRPFFIALSRGAGFGLSPAPTPTKNTTSFWGAGADFQGLLSGIWH